MAGETTSRQEARNAGAVQKDERKRRVSLLRVRSGFCHVLGTAVALGAGAANARSSGDDAATPSHGSRAGGTSAGWLSRTPDSNFAPGDWNGQRGERSGMGALEKATQ